MTATTFSHLSLQAGTALATTLGRGGRWAFAQYMNAPMASTGLLALVTFTAMAGSNALYFQTMRHPAPFFSPSLDAAVSIPVPVTSNQQTVAPVPQLPPAQQTVALPQISQETTSSVPAVQVVPDQPVGNSDAFAVQKRLTELGLFSGKVDGFYGPMTASAIRAFEQRNGMTPNGALTRSVIDAILRSDANGRVPVAVQPVVAPAPAPVVIQPQPQPIAQVQVTPPQAEPAPQLIARIEPLSPVENAVDTVGNAAAQTIDSLVAAVGNRGGTTPAKPILAAPVQTMPALVQASSAPVAPPATVPVTNPANNVELVTQIQRGLASLGFYRGSIDGHPGDGTSRAIREFENFYSFRQTGQINADLVGLLRQAGATI